MGIPGKFRLFHAFSRPAAALRRDRPWRLCNQLRLGSMTGATAAFDDVDCFDGRIFLRGIYRRLTQIIRAIANTAAMGLAAVAAVGLLIVIVAFAAAWIVNTTVSNPHAQARAAMGPLALASDAPVLTGAVPETFADKWAQATATLQVAAVPIATPQTQVATLVPPAAPIDITPLPPKRPAAMANIVPLPQPYPMKREIAVATDREIGKEAGKQIIAPVVAAAPPSPVEKRAAPVQEAHNRPQLPGPGSRVAVYDIAAHTVYLPDGERLEAHSGLGEKMDDPRFVKVRMRGPTPPNVYDLTLREEIFHGVRAIRLNPVDDDKMYGRAGMLAHTYMLGPNGQSNGCVSFRDYRKFLTAYLNGQVDRLVVVARLTDMPPRVANERRGKAERFAAND